MVREKLADVLADAPRPGDVLDHHLAWRSRHCGQHIVTSPRVPLTSVNDGKTGH
jgi:hypothetical protein